MGPDFDEQDLPKDEDIDELYYEVCGDSKLDFYDDGRVVATVFESSLDTI